MRMKRFLDFLINIAVGFTVSPIVDIVIHQKDLSPERFVGDLILFLSGWFLAVFVIIWDN